MRKPMNHPILSKLGQKDKKDVKIAVIGATNDSSKYGNKIYQDLKRKGYQVFAINPKATTIEGDKAYKSIEDLDVEPDIFNFVVPAKIGFIIVQEAVEMGFDNFWFQPGAESDEIIDYLSRRDKIFLANACIMVDTI